MLRFALPLALIPLPSRRRPLDAAARHGCGPTVGKPRAGTLRFKAALVSAPDARTGRRDRGFVVRLSADREFPCSG